MSLSQIDTEYIILVQIFLSFLPCVFECIKHGFKIQNKTKELAFYTLSITIGTIFGMMGIMEQAQVLSEIKDRMKIDVSTLGAKGVNILKLDPNILPVVSGIFCIIIFLFFGYLVYLDRNNYIDKDDLGLFFCISQTLILVFVITYTLPFVYIAYGISALLTLLSVRSRNAKATIVRKLAITANSFWRFIAFFLVTPINIINIYNYQNHANSINGDSSIKAQTTTAQREQANGSNSATLPDRSLEPSKQEGSNNDTPNAQNSGRASTRRPTLRSDKAQIGAVEDSDKSTSKTNPTMPTNSSFQSEDRLQIQNQNPKIDENKGNFNPLAQYLNEIAIHIFLLFVVLILLALNIVLLRNIEANDAQIIILTFKMRAILWIGFISFSASIVVYLLRLAGYLSLTSENFAFFESFMRYAFIVPFGISIFYFVFSLTCIEIYKFVIESQTDTLDFDIEQSRIFKMQTINLKTYGLRVKDIFSMQESDIIYQDPSDDSRMISKGVNFLMSYLYTDEDDKPSSCISKMLNDSNQYSYASNRLAQKITQYLQSIGINQNVNSLSDFMNMEIENFRLENFYNFSFNFLKSDIIKDVLVENAIKTHMNNVIDNILTEEGMRDRTKDEYQYYIEMIDKHANLQHDNIKYSTQHSAPVVDNYMLSEQSVNQNCYSLSYTNTYVKEEIKQSILKLKMISLLPKKIVGFLRYDSKILNLLDNQKRFQNSNTNQSLAIKKILGKEKFEPLNRLSIIDSYEKTVEQIIGIPNYQTVFLNLLQTGKICIPDDANHSKIIIHMFGLFVLDHEFEGLINSRLKIEQFLINFRTVLLEKIENITHQRTKSDRGYIELFSSNISNEEMLHNLVSFSICYLLQIAPSSSDYDSIFIHVPDLVIKYHTTTEEVIKNTYNSETVQAKLVKMLLLGYVFARAYLTIYASSNFGRFKIDDFNRIFGRYYILSVINSRITMSLNVSEFIFGYSNSSLMWKIEITEDPIHIGIDLISQSFESLYRSLKESAKNNTKYADLYLHIKNVIKSLRSLNLVGFYWERAYSGTQDEVVKVDSNSILKNMTQAMSRNQKYSGHGFLDLRMKNIHWQIKDAMIALNPDNRNEIKGVSFDKFEEYFIAWMNEYYHQTFRPKLTELMSSISEDVEIRSAIINSYRSDWVQIKALLRCLKNINDKNYLKSKRFLLKEIVKNEPASDLLTNPLIAGTVFYPTLIRSIDGLNNFKRLNYTTFVGCRFGTNSNLLTSEGKMDDIFMSSTYVCINDLKYGQQNTTLIINADNEAFQQKWCDEYRSIFLKPKDKKTIILETPDEDTFSYQRKYVFERSDSMSRANVKFFLTNEQLHGNQEHIDPGLIKSNPYYCLYKIQNKQIFSLSDDSCLLSGNYNFVDKGDTEKKILLNIVDYKHNANLFLFELIDKIYGSLANKNFKRGSSALSHFYHGMRDNHYKGKNYEYSSSDHWIHNTPIFATDGVLLEKGQDAVRNYINDPNNGDSGPKATMINGYNITSYFLYELSEMKKRYPDKAINWFQSGKESFTAELRSAAKKFEKQSLYFDTKQDKRGSLDSVCPELKYILSKKQGWTFDLISFVYSDFYNFENGKKMLKDLGRDMKNTKSPISKIAYLRLDDPEMIQSEMGSNLSNAPIMRNGTAHGNRGIDRLLTQGFRVCNFEELHFAFSSILDKILEEIDMLLEQNPAVLFDQDKTYGMILNTDGLPYVQKMKVFDFSRCMDFKGLLK